MKFRPMFLLLAMACSAMAANPMPPRIGQPELYPPTSMKPMPEGIKRCDGVQGLADPTCQEQRRLRNLRLRDAMQEGDLAPEAVRRPQPPEDHWLAPNDRQPPKPGKPNYWRDKHKKLLEQYQQE